MMTPALSGASNDIATYLINSYQNPRGVHAETVIAAAAALAGEFALRGVEPALPERGWVASVRASSLIFGNPAKDEPGLWYLLRYGALKAGAQEAELPQPAEVWTRVTGAVGGAPFPPLSVPERHYPHEWSPSACPRLRGGIEAIARTHGLHGADTAKAMTLAIVLLFQQTNEALPPAIAATLALEVMVGVAHMVPMTMADAEAYA